MSYYKNISLYSFQADMAYKSMLYELEHGTIKGYCKALINYRIATANLMSNSTHTL